MRPLWRNVAGSFATLVPVPAAAELWYDPRDISFLHEDEIDVASIQAQEAQTIRTLTDAGFTPESVIQAVASRDFGLLIHTGLFSVQLQPPDPTGLNANDANAGKALAKLIAPHLPTQGGDTKPKPSKE